MNYKIKRIKKNGKSKVLKLEYDVWEEWFWKFNFKLRKWWSFPIYYYTKWMTDAVQINYEYIFKIFVYNLCKFSINIHNREFHKNNMNCPEKTSFNLITVFYEYVCKKKWNPLNSVAEYSQYSHTFISGRKLHKIVFSVTIIARKI